MGCGKTAPPWGARVAARVSLLPVPLLLALVLILGAIRATTPTEYIGASWLSLLLGIWMILSPFVLGLTMFHGLVWHNIILGIIVGLLALWSALATAPPTTTRAV